LGGHDQEDAEGLDERSVEPPRISEGFLQLQTAICMTHGRIEMDDDPAFIFT
jgi:hypothetical protein